MFIHNDSNKRRILYFFAFICLVFSKLLVAADVSTHVDRNPATLNEQLIITFTANQRIDGQPDFSPLNQDFDVISQSQRSSIQSINGKTNQSFSWHVKVYPKKAGKITIPSVNFGSVSSQAVMVDVVAASTGSQGQSNSAPASDVIFLEAEVDPKIAYVQQQIVYTQRLFFARQFYDNATLSTPNLKAGKIDIEKLGNSREYRETRNGKEYRVIEHRYAIFPIQSGKLTIAPTFFEGRLIDSTQRQQNFGGIFQFSTPGRSIRRYSPEISLDVQPQAKNYQGANWLPASNITLHANWSTAPNQAKTGEPITLNLGIIANGLRAEQLPQLNIKLPDGLKTYNDQPSMRNESNSKEIVGTRQEKIVVVAVKPGNFTIPDMTLDWWDVKSQSQRTATVKIANLSVTGEASTATPTKPNNTETKSNEQPDNKSAENQNDNSTPQPTVYDPESSKDNSTSLWFYISLLLFALLAVLSYFFWKQSQNPKPSNNPTVAPKKPSNNEVLSSIQTACEKGDHQELRDALISWGNNTLNLPNANLQIIADTVTDRTLKTEILALMQAMYASNQSDWSSKVLCERVSQYQHKTKQNTTRSSIASLYPD